MMNPSDCHKLAESTLLQFLFSKCRSPDGVNDGTGSELLLVVVCGRMAALSLLFLTCKGKAVQLQAWSGPEGSRKLRLPVYITTAQDGG